ncbi:MAG: peptide chain release factor N(5)-glutamine methyltransferase [Oscillospiraceae bacterium]|nr:peptide chain release factor N(5)-glutamine methyltransferase [Oscillospiraceae bacterium]
MKTYNDLTLTIRKELIAQGVESAQLESRLLVAHAAGKTVPELLRDMNLYTTDAIVDKAMSYLQRRTEGEPVAYITGSWEFYGIPLAVTPDVLIPRMDTEVMIDAVKELLVGRKMDARILDLCCGSGCIACALAKEMPATRLVCVDISASALQVCRLNIDRNHLESRVLCMQADALSSPPLGIGLFDVIVSNPPYIATEEIDTLDPSVRDHEPFWALDGGEDGLKFYKGIIKHWRTVLRPGGLIFFEVGENQAETVTDMLLRAGFAEAECREDSAGIPRVVIGRTSENESV